MKEEDQWVCWRTEERDGKATKVPINPYTGGYAKSNDTSTWSDFDTALAYNREAADIEGVGFMFHEDGLYAGVDLDDCRDPKSGDVEDWAKDILDQLESYTERSPSGTGFHVIVYGFVPDGGNRRRDIEIYDSHRYFTVTGDRVPGVPETVEKRAKRLRDIHQEYIADNNRGVAPAQQTSGTDVDLPDEKLIEKAKNAANGDKFTALWNGDTSGYRSHSEADQALCNLLAFWTGGDPQRIEALFSQSGLVRDKWRERPEYREQTIRNAILSCSDFYEPTTND
jgi:primase-polymerase (primpol)-like protein